MEDIYMIAIPFDTLVYSHTLMEGGMPREQAEKMAEAQKKVFDNQNQNLQENLDKAISTHLATKEDVWSLKQDISNLDKKIDSKTMGLDKKIDLLRKEFEGKFNLLYWILGFILAFCVSIAFKLY